MIALCAAAFFTIPVASASAMPLTVALGGAGTGTIRSNPPGIECSNTPGKEKLSLNDCSAEFEFLAGVNLMAIPDNSFVLGSWTGNALVGTCNSGNANPCNFTMAFEPVAIEGTFVPAPPAPLATTGAASEVNHYRAKLAGTVDPEGTPVADCYFEYGPTIAYGETSPCVPSAANLGTGTAAVSVNANTAGLDSSTTYHYRLVASNPGGASKGEDKTFTTEEGPQDTCPNAAIRAEQGAKARVLPQCMALEMATPPAKYNQDTKDPAFSPSGERLQFHSLSALAETPIQGFIIEPYLTTRTGSGWVTTPTALSPSLRVGFTVTGTPCAYSVDLSRWNTWASTRTQGSVGITTAFAAGIGIPFFPLSPTLSPTKPIPPFNVGNGFCEGGSADASHEFFGIAEAGYLPGDPTNFSTYRSKYDAYRDENGTPTVELLQRDGNGKVHGGGCGALIGGSPYDSQTNSAYRGSVSPSGLRVFFTTRPGQTAIDACASAANKTRIMKRIQTDDGPWISELIASECTRVSPTCDLTDGNDYFSGASQEGGRVFFITARQLANSDLDAVGECSPTPGLSAGCDLYLHDASSPAGARLTQVSAGDATDPTPGKDAKVLGVADFAGDGSRAYFVASGILTTNQNPAGDTAQAGEPNLYMYERDAAHPGGRTDFVATLTPADNKVWDGAPGENAAAAVPVLGTDVEDQSVGGDGHVLTFFSGASLTADDADGGAADLYRYDAEADGGDGALERVSAADSGGSDNGPFSTNIVSNQSSLDRGNPGPQLLSFGNWTSEDANTMVFETAEALDPADPNGAQDAYIWHEGSVTAILTGTQPTVSMSGKSVAFGSRAQLLPQDGDTAEDIYVARANGGFPTPVPPVPCVGEACQALGSRPSRQTTASESFNGTGNVKSAAQFSCPKGKRRVRRNGKARCTRKATSRSRNANAKRRAGK